MVTPGKEAHMLWENNTGPCWAVRQRGQEIYRIMKENHQLLQNIETCQPALRQESQFLIKLTIMSKTQCSYSQLIFRMRCQHVPTWNASLLNSDDLSEISKWSQTRSVPMVFLTLSFFVTQTKSTPWSQVPTSNSVFSRDFWWDWMNHASCQDIWHDEMG